MKRYPPAVLLLLLTISFTGFPVLNAQESVDLVNRSPAASGSFYPAGKQALETTLKELFASAEPAELPGRVRSLVVPHAGYIYSGKVAASGYATIPEDAEYQNIFIIASSHRVQFNGSSVYAAGNYLTPLGEAEVNLELAQSLIERNRQIVFEPRAHQQEHSIEVQIPFLQYRFKELPPIVPIVMGSSSLATARNLAQALLPYFTPENLFIISTDFSHYPAYEDARRIDGITARAIVENDPGHFYSTLQSNSQEQVDNLVTSCCGWSSVMTLLYMTDQQDDVTLKTVIYRNSGDAVGGDKSSVVGYWAIAGYDTSDDMAAGFIDETEQEALLEIAKGTLDSYLRNGEIMEISTAEVTPALKQQAGVFVSLYAGERLRGCIGNFSPSEPLYRVVQEMTLAAALRDTRFAPVDPSELEYITVEISVLTPLQRITSIDEFELGKHGIFMKKGASSGTLLPQVAESTGWTKEEFLGHCAREKAGIGWEGWKEAELYVYEAIVFGEEKR